jgi:hypothetical protein
MMEQTINEIDLGKMITAAENKTGRPKPPHFIAEYPTVIQMTAQKTRQLMARPARSPTYWVLALTVTDAVPPFV